MSVVAYALVLVAASVVAAMVALEVQWRRGDPG